MISDYSDFHSTLVLLESCEEILRNSLSKILFVPLIVTLFSFLSPAQVNSSGYDINPDNRNTPVTYVKEVNTQQDSGNLLKTDSIDINKSSPVKENKISLTRVGIVSGASLSILGGLYYRWKTAWWNNGSTKFHFYYDYSYAENVDKLGHINGGILVAECFGVGLKWAGLDDESSLLYGALLGTLVYTGIELKDGFAPGWGFDPADLGASVVGSFFPYAQKKITFLQNFNFKYSYFPSHSTFYEHMNKESQNNQFFNDDYEGETFWLSANVKNLLPKRVNSIIPDFFNLACGVSVENLNDDYNKHLVFVISPDIDLVKLFKPDTELLKSLLHLLNYIHIPMPGLQVSPNFKGYFIYLKP